MYKPEIHFNGPEYDGIESQLGNLSHKLVNIVNDHARNTRGKAGLSNPTDIEVTPHMLDEPKFLVRSWHETAAPAGMIGILQPQTIELRFDFSSEDLLLTTDAEASPSYLLTTREAFLITGIGVTAALRSIIANPTFENGEY
jgi:hypothetical protein